MPRSRPFRGGHDRNHRRSVKITVYGRLLPAAESLRICGLPIGLAQGVEVTREIAAGEALSWRDVSARESDDVVRVRREMERMFAAAATPESAALLR